MEPEDKAAGAFRMFQDLFDGLAPREPNSDARAAARELRNLFDAFRDEGFTSSESIALIGELVRAAL